MTAIPSTTSAGPIPESERLRTLDLLRGFALLGIFMVNMQFFTMVFAAFSKPQVYEGGPLSDLLAWGFVKAFFEYKFISLFSLLFGAGMVMQMMRAEAKGRPFIPTYLRRMGVLAIIGLLHGFLLWYGDILFVYSVVGMVALLARTWRPRTLLVTAGGIIAFFLVAQVALGALFLAISERFDTATDAHETAVASGVEGEQPPRKWSEKNPELAERYPWMASMFDVNFNVVSEEWMAAETTAYKEGPFTDATAFRAFSYLLLVFASAVTYAWRVLATFLIGAALMKLRIFEPSAAVWHRRLCFIGLGLGIPAELANTWLNYLAGTGEWMGFALIGVAIHEPGSLLMALGFIGGAGMIVSSGILPRLVRAISAVGRLALSNYLLQSVVSTFLMYHWGLGYFGDVPRPWQIALVFAIYALQIPLSILWLRFFTIGPMEWIWRSLTYWKRQPMRRKRYDPAV